MGRAVVQGKAMMSGWRRGRGRIAVVMGAAITPFLSRHRRGNTEYDPSWPARSGSISPPSNAIRLRELMRHCGGYRRWGPRGPSAKSQQDYAEHTQSPAHETATMELQTTAHPVVRTHWRKRGASPLPTLSKDLQMRPLQRPVGLEGGLDGEAVDFEASTISTAQGKLRSHSGLAL